MDLVPGWSRTCGSRRPARDLRGPLRGALRAGPLRDARRRRRRDENAFQTWLGGHRPLPDASAKPDVAAEGRRFSPCVPRVTARRAKATALNAPKLAGQSGWYIARQIRNFKAGLRGAKDEDTYGKQMAAMAGTLDDDRHPQRDGLSCDTPRHAADSTVPATPTKGHSLYTTCGACHGPYGDGVWTTNAPRLAHMSDWYMAAAAREFPAAEFAAVTRWISRAGRWSRWPRSYPRRQKAHPTICLLISIR